MTKTDRERQRKAPILRFKGFTDDWEQRELREIAKKRTEKNRNLLTNNVLSNSAIYGIVKQTEYFDKSIANNIQNYHLVYENDFVYNPRISNNAPFGPISRNKLNELGIMSPLYLVFYFSTKSLSDYLEIYFKSSKWHKFMYMNGNSGARSDRFAIKDNDFFRMKIKMPHSKDEINKIYKFNILLYKLLTLYERKLKLLSQVKKYFLDNLFTEKEYPNLRFKGFTDAWEQRKLGEVTLFIRNGVTVKQNGSYGIPITRIESISTGTLNLKKVGYADIQTDKYKDFYLKNNDILFSNINSLEHIGKTAFVQHLSLDVIHGMNLLNIRINEESISSKFIYYQLLIMKYNNLFKRVAKPAVNQASIATSELKKLVIKIPDVNEQHKIQALLTRLERIITLYENKQQSLSEIKKTLLNTMFI